MVLQQWREEGSLYAVIDAAADPSLVANNIMSISQ